MKIVPLLTNYPMHAQELERFALALRLAPQVPAQKMPDEPVPSALAMILDDWGDDEEDAKAPVETPISKPGPLVSLSAPSAAKTGRPRKLEALLPLAQEWLRLKKTHGAAAPTVRSYLQSIGQPCSERTFYSALKGMKK